MQDVPKFLFYPIKIAKLERSATTAASIHVSRRSLEDGPLAVSDDELTEAERGEAWIRTAGGDQAIRVRSLAMMLDRGAVLTEVRLVEREDQTWAIYFRVSDRPGDFRLNRVRADEPKTYRDVALAIAAIREDFHYMGPISCVTERFQARPARTKSPE
jgi:hypothetical protein